MRDKLFKIRRRCRCFLIIWLIPGWTSGKGIRIGIMKNHNNKKLKTLFHAHKSLNNPQISLLNLRPATISAMSIHFIVQVLQNTKISKYLYLITNRTRTWFSSNKNNLNNKCSWKYRNRQKEYYFWNRKFTIMRIFVRDC